MPPATDFAGLEKKCIVCTLPKTTKKIVVYKVPKWNCTIQKDVNIQVSSDLQVAQNFIEELYLVTLGP